MDEQQRIYRNGIKVNSLYRAVRDSQAVKLIPDLVKQVIDDDMWREHFFEKTGETFQFSSFQEFIEKHPPDGLGIEVKTLFTFCVDDPTVMETLDQAIQATAKELSADNEKLKKLPISNARQAGLRKLRQLSESDEAVAALRQSVLAGEISVNAALTAAGLKKKRISIPKDVAQATKSLKRIYSQEEIRQSVGLLESEDG